MREKTKLKIGEFSQMMQVTVKTLRHYEQKGLLFPCEVDKCTVPGYCFTIEHNKEYRPTDIDIEYCEQVEEMGTDNTIIQFKHLDAVPKALCMKHVGPYERFHESFTKAFAYMEEQGYKMAGPLRTSYIDGAWNKEDPEQCLSVIQIPIE